MRNGKQYSNGFRDNQKPNFFLETYRPIKICLKFFSNSIKGLWNVFKGQDDII